MNKRHTFLLLFSTVDSSLYIPVSVKSDVLNTSRQITCLNSY